MLLKNILWTVHGKSFYGKMLEKYSTLHHVLYRDFNRVTHKEGANQRHFYVSSKLC